MRQFAEMDLREAQAYAMGFKHAAVGAMVRSSYHADQQAHSATQATSQTACAAP